jgi:hypothetical protein
LVTAASNVAIAAGSGTVTHTGTLTSGTLIQGNGGADITLNATSATVTKLTSGVPSAATAGTDYVAPGSITSDGITMATARLLGRTTASTGAVEEITVGTGLTLSAGSLTASGGTGTVTHTGALTANQLVVGNGTADIKVSDLTGDVTTSGGVATTIANSAVTYAKIQNVSANSKLLGSSATGSGSPPSEIALGTGISMSGSTLNATGTGGTVTTTGSPASGNLTKFSGASSITNADLTGDVTTSGTEATTLATVNLTTGTFADSTHVGQFTVNGKGLITAASNVAITASGIGGATPSFAFFMG